MNRTFKSIAASALALLLVCACIPFCVQAADACGENVFRSYDAETNTVTLYGSGPTFDLDSDPDGVPSDYARVVIEAGVTYVGANMFGNDAIGELVLPDTPLEVNTNAFSDCTIDRVMFPQTATDAAQYEFGDGYEDFAGAVVYALDLGGLDGFPVGFRFCFGDNYDLRELIVGANTTEIPEYACNCFGSLTSLTLPDGLLSIGDGAFESCESLYSVRIPDSVTTIGDYAFDFCTNIREVTLPKQLLTIGDWAFCTCENLSSVTIPGNTTTIGESAFEDCASLTEVTIPNSMKTICANAFAGTALYNVHLPAGLESVDATAFGTALQFVCCDTEDCPAVMQFCQDAGVEFRQCDGHGSDERIAGDTDGDGVITLRDVVLIERYLAGGWNVTIDESASDVNGDGQVTLQDVTCLTRFIAGGWDVELL